MVEHDENREKELQLLCSEIVSLDLEFEGNVENKAYCYYCPLCFAELTEKDSDSLGKCPTMKDVKHKINCAYLIAKSLFTGKDK